VVVEGNSFTRYLWPDRMIMVARAELDEVKPTARALLGKADLVVLNGAAGSPDRRREEWKRRLSAEYGVSRVVDLDAATADLVELLRQLGVKT
jgi:hypothetical protein